MTLDMQIARWAGFGWKTGRSLPLSIVAALLITAVPADGNAGELAIYTWRADTAAELPGAFPLVWAQVNYGLLPKPAAADYGTARPAKVVALEVASHLAGIGASHRALLLYYAGVAHGLDGEPGLFPKDQRLITAVAQGGFPEFTTRWMAEFWPLLAKRDLAPALILLDYEDAWGFWGVIQGAADAHIGSTGQTATPEGMPEWAHFPVMVIDQVHHALGDRPVAADPVDYVRDNGGWRWNRGVIPKFNAWQDDRRSRALRKSIVDTATFAYGRDIPSCNYGDQRRMWSGIDSNGWLQLQEELTGNISCPATYLGSGGQRYLALKPSKSTAFLHALSWVDRRNDIRSAVAARSVTAPWYSNPDYGCDHDQGITECRLFWAAGLLHDRSIGINTMLFWSGETWKKDEVEFARPIIAYLLAMKPATVGDLSAFSAEEPELALSKWLNLAKEISAHAELRRAK